MLEGLIHLINYIRELLASYQTRLEELDKENDFSSSRLKEIGAKLANDSSYLIDIDLNTICEILKEKDFSDEERQNQIARIHAMKILLDLNKKENTSYELTFNQLVVIKELINNIDEVSAKLSVKQEKITSEMAEITKKTKKYLTLLGYLEDKKNKTFITDVYLIEEILDELAVDDEKRKQIYLDILRYNKRLFIDNVDLSNESERLNVEEVKYLFGIYDYDFTSLGSLEKEDILNNASISNMQEVFSTLNELHYPKLDSKKDGIKLAGLLIGSTRHSIIEMTNLGKERNLSTKDIIMLPQILIPKKMISLNDKSISLSRITSKKDDFKENILFLESVGLDISYVYTRCRELLIMPTHKLKRNYKYFTSYGFRVLKDEYGNMLNPLLTCLITEDFFEIIDQFIETSEYGYLYIKDNLDTITSYSSAHDIVFYNIYASYLTEDEKHNKLIPQGPFVDDVKEELILRDEITRRAGSGFENVAYLGITDKNKRNKTRAMKVIYEHEKEFLNALEKAKTEEIFELSRADKNLISLEDYTDNKNKYRYLLNGIAISKPKVKRIYNILKNYNLHNLEDSLLFSITYNTILTRKDLDRIKNAIYKVKEGEL